MFVHCYFTSGDTGCETFQLNQTKIKLDYEKSGRIELKCMSGNVFTSHQHSTLAEALVRVIVLCEYLQSVYSELLKSHPKRRN